MAKGNLFWHVPEWFGGTPGFLGVDNVGSDIIVELVNTEDVASLAQDNFIVERVVGQYLVTSSEVSPPDRFLHSRVYVTMGDVGSLFTRDLTTADDADTSFMFTKVEPFPAAIANENWGTWTGDSRSVVRNAGGVNDRLGFFDIRVGRRVDEGTSLIWHSEFTGATPGSGQLHMQMWVRVLLKEA